MFLLLLFSCLFSACSYDSYEDFREEGHGVIRSLIKELEVIRSRDDVLSASPQLENLFLRLAQVMATAQQFEAQNPQLTMPGLSAKDHALSDQLRGELNRIYRLEGGKEAIEKCREPALKLLDLLPEV
jgi:hypothetical protein